MLAGSTTLADVYVWFTYLHSSSAKDSEDSSVTYSANTVFGFPFFTAGFFQRDGNKEISSINIKGGLCGEGFGGERVFTDPVFQGVGKLPDEEDINKTDTFNWREQKDK